ncbi:cora-domain-containing protein [Xylariaceae sp. FL0255]|nr:cora-domain-containing protein [Xylariaceae sp. FL0255]
MASNTRSVPGYAGASASPAPPGTQSSKKKHRAGRKHKRSRRKSFAVPPDELVPSNNASATSHFYAHARNSSNTSLDSEALLDHRDHQYPRARRPSALATSYSMPQPSMSRMRSMTPRDNDGTIHESTPLLSRSIRHDSESPRRYGVYHERSPSRPRSGASNSKLRLPGSGDRHNINYPPSMPGSPPLGPTDRLDMSFPDVMMRDHDHPLHGSAAEAASDPLLERSSLDRRHNIALQAEEDVCFPQDGMSEIADDELQQARDKASLGSRRRRRGKWPDLAILEEWSRMEQEDRSEVRRMKKITEPQLVNGRLRPVNRTWFRTEEDAPYRFTYFNEELQSTIHSQTISELVQPDSSFKELFIPDPPVLSESSSDEEDEELVKPFIHYGEGSEQTSKGPTRQPSLGTVGGTQMSEPQAELGMSPKQTPAPPSFSIDGSVPKGTKLSLVGDKSPPPIGQDRKTRYGERPVWWLDVLSPTEAEMRVISKAFGIHPLTSEDIMLQEQREKVELFRHYYFVNYRSFDQDAESENHLDPVNMYVIVFREGVLSFHFSQTPHPANVRRRIRQLKDFMMLSSDWISYAIIDDITDVYQPLIQSIEDEVDDIDDKILQLHSTSDPDSSSAKQKRDGEEEKSVVAEGNIETGADMLRRVGDCRKKVMTLYRLLGNKADVIKGFAKRCNEQWQVAPRSEIGLYLGDIQDHIVTMTANLSHYEKILARCHANYIAQINIRMNERAEQTADVLGKLTVLGTIVLPMNIITGLWGMNVWVPGQEYEGDLSWFFAITGGLVIFGLACFWIAKRVYNIV